MRNSKPQPDFDAHYVAELGEALRQALPFLEKLVLLGQALRPQKAKESTSLPCTSCSKDHCSGPCDALNAVLPAVYEGRGHREHFSKLGADDLQHFRKVRFSDIFEQYQDCRHIFTDKQWVVIEFYYQDGKTEDQIAKEIGKARTTVSDRLNRARRRKENYDRKVRRETFGHLRKKDQW